MAIIKTGRCTVLQPILIPLWVYLLHKSHLSRILICHCCFLCNNIITMMYYSEKGEESFIISGSEKTRSTLLYNLVASSTQASSPLTVLSFHHRKRATQESALAVWTKTISTAQWSAQPVFEELAHCVFQESTLVTQLVTFCTLIVPLGMKRQSRKGFFKGTQSWEQ